MAPAAPAVSSPQGHDRRAELRNRLRQLEAETLRVHAELASLAPGERLPGLFTVIEVAGFAGLVQASSIREIVRLVECTPLPNAPAHVLGTFMYRGESAIALDLAAYLSKRRDLSVEAHMVILAAERPLALVVDRVRTLVEAPQLLGVAGGGEAALEPWRAGRLIAGICRVGDELLPLVGVRPLLEGLEEQVG